jgi:hypothetical protein
MKTRHIGIGRKTIILSVAAALGIGSASGAAAQEPSVPDGYYNAVLDWWEIKQNALFVNSGYPTWVGGIQQALVQGAVYDAVNGISGTYEPYLGTPRSADRNDSPDAAAATAAYRVLVTLLPDQRPDLEAKYAESLAKIPDGTAKEGGIVVGAEAAAAMLRARANDGRWGDLEWVVGTEPGQWRPTPPNFAIDQFAWVAKVRPFLIPSVEQFRAAGPHPLTSVEYAADFNEIKTIGSRTSDTRTPDQTEAARYWHTPPWGSIVRSLVESGRISGTGMARLFAMIALGTADTTMLCFDGKYRWSFWRPITAIREAAADGNPNTAPDPAWTPLIDTPIHPEHPSGHTCSSGSITNSLRLFFGRDDLPFSAFSFGSMTTRSFTSLSQAVDEVINARVWAGIHFRRADIIGTNLGKSVTDYMAAHYFRRK